MLNFVHMYMKTFMQFRGNEVVGMPNCCERRQIDFTGLRVTLSRTTAICCSARQERSRPGDLAAAIEPVVLNFVISLRTVDSLAASLLPKMVPNVQTVCVALSPFW